MNEHVHPTFAKILNDFFGAEPRKEITVASNIFDLLTDGLDGSDLVDMLQEIDSFIDEIKKDSEKVVRVLRHRYNQARKELIENEICPNCGGTLYFSSDHSGDTYVPYGSGSVSLDDGGSLVCRECGEEYDDD